MRDIKHTDLKDYISVSRLSTYQNFFNPSDDVELLGCYLWSKEVSAAFFPLIQAFEVTLRNAIHKEAHNKWGSFWFDHIATKPMKKLSPSQKRAVSTLKSSITQARQDLRREMRLPEDAHVHEDKIIAKLTFGFWTTLFNAAFDVNRNKKAMWPTLLKPIFPNAPKGALNREDLQRKLTTVRTFRNKAFHHEPVWNIGQPATIQDSISKLHSTKDLCLELMNWMSHDSEELVRKAGYISTIDRVCSEDHLGYLKDPGCNDVPLSRAKRELRGILRDSLKVTDITINKEQAGKVIVP